MTNYCDYFMTTDEDREYHDEEWGHPIMGDDRKMFEYLSLEVMQCGLSWRTIFKRREIMRECFDNFDIDKVAAYTEADVKRIITTEGMLKTANKVRAIINNAKVSQRLGSLCDYFWSFTNGHVVVYDGHPDGEIPAQNGLSQRVAKDLRLQGMKFIGPVNIYAHLQACGIINDHSKMCPTFQEIINNYPIDYLPKDNEK